MHSSFSMRWDGTKCGKEETRINIPQKKKKKKEEDTGGRGRGWRYGTEESKSRPSGRAFLFRAGAEQSSAVPSRLVSSAWSKAVVVDEGASARARTITIDTVDRMGHRCARQRADPPLPGPPACTVRCYAVRCYCTVHPVFRIGHTRAVLPTVAPGATRAKTGPPGPVTVRCGASAVQCSAVRAGPLLWRRCRRARGFGASTPGAHNVLERQTASWWISFLLLLRHRGAQLCSAFCLSVCSFVYRYIYM